MSKAHYLAPQATLLEDALTVRLGSTGAGKFTQAEVGKFIKLAGESMFDLCAAGDAIEGICLSVEPATSGGQTVGSLIDDALLFVIADGLQATAGVGVIAVGDFVVCGTVTAKGTGLASSGVGGLPKVCKATVQPNGSDPGSTAAAGTAIKNAMFGWRVESLGVAGTGAVGTQILIRRITS